MKGLLSTEQWCSSPSGSSATSRSGSAMHSHPLLHVLYLPARCDPAPMRTHAAGYGCSLLSCRHRRLVVAWRSEAQAQTCRSVPQVLWTGPGDIAWARHTPLTVEERSTVQLFKDNTPAVVYITNLRAG